MNALAFGAWLKRRRRSLDLTQDELADRSGCSVETVRKLEAETLRPSKALAERLAEYLAIPAEQRDHFVRFARGQADAEQLPSSLPTVAPTPLPLPPPVRPTVTPPTPPTPLIGREQQTRDVCDLLQQPYLRLLTLTGVGGVGKTRLALQVAAALADDFPAGVYFVPLAAIHDANLVVSTIAQVLGVRENGAQPLADSLVGWLGDKQILLVLDNFEQVLDAASVVAHLVSQCPSLKVLVTSRARLHVQAEHQYRVPPLALPPLADEPQPILDYGLEVADYPAVQLFVQRARRVKPEFRLTEANQQAVAEICHRLDGLPLAIELAAARVHLLPPPALLQRLTPRLALLTGGPRDLPARQQTMRAAIDWSYDLLEAGEKQLYRRLAVFVEGFTLEAAAAVAGGFTLEAAAAVAGEEGTDQDRRLSILEGVSSLTDKSLVHQVETLDEEPRFSLLETVREYGLERLAESGELDLLRGRHADYCLHLAQAASPELWRTQQAIWFVRLEADHPNLREALHWLIERGEGEEGLKLAGALWRFWYIRGYFAEGRHWLELALSQQQTASAAVRALALYGVANLAFAQGDPPVVHRCLEESMALWKAAGDQEGLAASLHVLANMALNQGDYLKARDLEEEGLVIDRALNNSSGIARKLQCLGLALYRLGEYAAARAVLEESLVLLRSLGDRVTITYAQNFLALTLRAEGRYAEARALHESSLAIQEATGDQFGLPGTLHNLGIVIAMLGDLEEGERLCTDSLHLAQKLGKKRDTGLPSITLGYLTQRRGDRRAALSHFHRSLTMFAELDDRFESARSLAGLAGLLWSYGERDLSARQASAAEGLLERTRGRMEPRERADYESSVAPIRTAVSDRQLADAWATGRTWTLTEAAQTTLPLVQKLIDGPSQTRSPESETAGSAR
ncbi:MAG: tetratricopeptide repeat protein [Anaerolineae bacterium]|nr:tetratricopeptide repeat protein [Anaerolineae bacterium]